MNPIKRERGEQANLALKKVKIRRGDPVATDKTVTVPKVPLKPEGIYWVYECPVCHGMMHACYITCHGVRYMCVACGKLEFGA